jgi:hypothetical protein
MFSLNDVGFLGSLAAAPAYDADAQVYITAVIAADVAAGNTSGLEVGVQDAINAFVVGCKADGIWTAIKASCILAGARTLSGALVPLVGTAPTNNNFVSGDYNRETGLGSSPNTTKYLNTNFALNYPGNTSNQDNVHLSVYASANSTSGTLAGAQGAAGSDVNRLVSVFSRNRNGSANNAATFQSGFIGNNRSVSTEFIVRSGGSNTTRAATSTAPSSSQPYYVCANNGNGPAGSYSTARIAFYSIGESLNLALLDTRVTTLINAIAAAIP